MRVDATSYRDAVRRIAAWAEAPESRSVCVAAVNNVIRSRDDPGFRRVMNGADLVTPDGAPLVWALRLLGVARPTRVVGTSLMWAVCALAAERSIPIGLYGGTPEVLGTLVGRLRDRWPALEIAYRESPPFRALTPQEEAVVRSDIEASGARIVFVGLGAPKQEEWMDRHRGELPAVMIGVGAAFDFIAGSKRRAPAWVQRAALEWLFRLVQEPRRLWKRYLLGNPRFLALLALQIAGRRLGPIVRRR